MSLILTYKNDFGTVVMNGRGAGTVRICNVEGLGPARKEYTAAAYSGQSGQKTLSSRALPRSITLGLEVLSRNMSVEMGKTLWVLSNPGTLYIENGDIIRRIFCNQVQIPEMKRILRDKIATFSVQFVCDSPYFEDGEDMVVPLYQRVKLIKTAFSMPCLFGSIITGQEIENHGSTEIEPQITMYYPEAIQGAQNITITNRTTGKAICLDYAPNDDDTVVIDVKNRSITSLRSGNLIGCLSDDTFLGDFVLVGGKNRIEVNLGDVTSGFTAECRYSNFYTEAVIV